MMKALLVVVFTLYLQLVISSEERTRVSIIDNTDPKLEQARKLMSKYLEKKYRIIFPIIHFDRLEAGYSESGPVKYGYYASDHGFTTGKHELDTFNCLALLLENEKTQQLEFAPGQPPTCFIIGRL